MSGSTSNTDQQNQVQSWITQRHPGVHVDFQNGTISGGSQPLNHDQLSQINDYISQNFSGMNKTFTYSGASQSRTASS